MKVIRRISYFGDNRLILLESSYW